MNRLERIKEKISKYKISDARDRQTTSCSVSTNSSCQRGVGRHSAMKLTESQHMNILQSMEQAAYIFDLNGHIIYWNRMSQHIFGYTKEEIIGMTAPDLTYGPTYSEIAGHIIHRAAKGESWSGEFPARNKKREMFNVVTTIVPYFDENGTDIGVLGICSDTRQFRTLRPSLDGYTRPSSDTFENDPLPSLQTTVTSKLSNLASKIKSNMKNNMDQGGNHKCNMVPFDHRDVTFSKDGHFIEKPTIDSSAWSESKPGVNKSFSSKAEAWLGKKGILWPWKEKEKDSSHIRMGHFGWPWLHNDHQEQDYGSQTTFSVSNSFEAPGSWSSSCSSSGCTNGRSINKFDVNIDYLDVEISWDDLIIRERIGQGSCGIAYHASWYGCDVAVKVFTKLECSCDVILSFRKEVSLMKRLRHPNILLFMGAVTSPQHLCIVSEFLPRGSLFQLLHQNTTKLDWRRRVHIAMDIAQGMNYLHHHQPPIVHRDLKSSNLLVDKNWTVKVGDFGLSQIKRETYQNTKTGKGTPEWMAPEVLRNKQADEKSDVYSYGVVLWEIVTQKIPRDNLDPVQVIGAVGYMNQRLEIPNDVNPQWASLIESCWSSEPQSRPTFHEILSKLKDLLKNLTVLQRKNRP